ncbi:MAG: flagellar hook-length control protein FliK [Steroidobacteraceae bacterium]
MMETAAGSISTLPLQLAQLPADPLTPMLVEGADFTAVLAAACAAEPDTSVPEDMQSAAAMAWLAGMLMVDRPAVPPPAADAVEDSAEALLATSLQAVEPALADAAPIDVLKEMQASAQQGQVATEVATVAKPLALWKAFGAIARDIPAAAQGDTRPADMATPAMNSAVAVAPTVTADRFISALVERASLMSAADADQPAIPSPALYTNTRDASVGAAAQTVVPAQTIHAPVGSPRWANELGSHLMTMSRHGQQEGSLSLTPEHLGPVEVRISVAEDTTSVWFGAQNAETRAALTDAMPRLREMFTASGLALGHAGVSHEMPRQDARRSEAPASGGSLNSAAAESAAAPVARRISVGLLDTWA